MAGVVGVTGADGQGSVDLFCGDDSGELVRQRDTAEGDTAGGQSERGPRPAVGWADREDQGLGAIVLDATEQGGEVF